MNVKWKRGNKSQFDPKSSEIYLNTETKEIMLMGDPYFSGGKSYYEYTTFTGSKAKESLIEQQDFTAKRLANKIVKVKIDNVELSQSI